MPSPAPPAAVIPPSTSPPLGGDSGTSSASQNAMVYYVLLDDGGARGVRFGCNDSLAGIPRPVENRTEPLAAAMRALLDGSAAPGLYSALAASRLTFLSGSFDGATVTVHLSGAIRPGGACDIPRVEAQLTQTAVTAVGAIRAEVYVNGVALGEVLSLDSPPVEEN